MPREESPVRGLSARPTLMKQLITTSNHLARKTLVQSKELGSNIHGFNKEAGFKNKFTMGRPRMIASKQLGQK